MHFKWTLLQDKQHFSWLLFAFFFFSRWFSSELHLWSVCRDFGANSRPVSQADTETEPVPIILIDCPEFNRLRWTCRVPLEWESYHGSSPESSRGDNSAAAARMGRKVGEDGGRMEEWYQIKQSRGSSSSSSSSSSSLAFCVCDKEEEE